MSAGERQTDELATAIAEDRWEAVAAWLSAAQHGSAGRTPEALASDLATCRWLASELDERRQRLLDELRGVRGARQASQQYDEVAALTR